VRWVGHCSSHNYLPMYDALYEAIAPILENADALYEYLVSYFGSEQAATEFVVSEDLVAT